MRLLNIFLAGLPVVAGLSARRSTRRQREDAALLQVQNSDNVDSSNVYPEYNFSIPIDHFHNISMYAPHTNDTFDNRYFFDASNYKPGGPVIILQDGETSVTNRLPFLQKGLIQQLAKLTHGIAVIFEHRYYGTSFPTEDLSTDNLRFLTTEQAMADEAFFAQNIVFPGLEHLDLTSKTTAYISYGGSYAGAFSAFLRVQYPDIFWGSIASSGVTEAIIDYSIYFLAFAKYAPSECVLAQQTITQVVDTILIGKNTSTLTAQLKSTFGLPNVTHDNDFAMAVASGVFGWQNLNWDPAASDPGVYQYCSNISSTSILYPSTAPLAPVAASLIAAAGVEATSSLVNQMLNLIGFVNLTEVAPCAGSGRTQDECFNENDPASYERDDISQYTWRSWEYQVCTEWGYFLAGKELPGGVAPVISKTIDLAYTSLVCPYAFNITSPPDIERVNKFGGFDLTAPRVAHIGGQWDPWLYATPLAVGYGAKPRPNTASEPFYVIPDAVHHWDENGVFDNQTRPDFPPQTITDVQSFEAQFVLEWMAEWQESQLAKDSSRMRIMQPMR